MSDQTLMLEILKELQRGQLDLRNEVREGFRQTNQRLAGVEHHMAGFHVALDRYNDDITSLQERVARLEKRLELTEGQPEG